MRNNLNTIIAPTLIIVSLVAQFGHVFIDLHKRVLSTAFYDSHRAGEDRPQGRSSQLLVSSFHSDINITVLNAEKMKKDTKKKKKKKKRRRRKKHRHDEETEQEPSSVSFNNSTMNDELPLQLRPENIVIAMVSFGNATTSTHVQRLVRSIRARGEWRQWVVIVTDNPSAYDSLVSQDPMIHIIEPRPQDYDPRLLPYDETKLKYKRFKTLLIEYVQNDPIFTIDDVSHILYMDVDIVVCKPLFPWIQDKWIEGANKRKEADPEWSIVYMFEEGGNSGRVAHGGLILQHVTLSEGCMVEWRKRMDETRTGRDQALLRAIIKEGEIETKCRIHRWKRKELIFPYTDYFESMKMEQFVHITNTHHSIRTDKMIQQLFLEKALNLTDEEKHDPHSLAIVPDNF
jgi:hypothetical protein